MLERFDTPETHHPTKPVQCYGAEAAAYTASRLFGQVCDSKTTSSATTSTAADSRTCISTGPTSSASSCGRAYARLLVIEPNHAHAREMLDDELNALRAGVGLWGACGMAERQPFGKYVVRGSEG